MKKIFLLVIYITIFGLGANAQNDTSLYYFSAAYKPTTSDSAYVVLKMFKKNEAWFGREFYKKDNGLKSEGIYLENNPETPEGSFKNFKENGSLDYIADWNNKRLVSKSWFYKNGNKKSLIAFNDKSIVQQKGWDEEGKEIKNYVVEREARFKGGMEGWRKYLEKHLNANVAADAGAPAGIYEVKLQFVVNKEGYVSKVKAVNIPASCKPCAAEAVNVISGGPQWEPAIQNNEPVIYQAIQFINFQVVDDKKSKKG